MGKKRNGTVSIMKVLFCLAIVLMHYSVPSTLGERGYFLGGGYIFVDFFFILQGNYLLRGSATPVSNETWIEFFKKNLLRYVPCTFFMTMLLFFLQLISVDNVRSVARLIGEGVFQLSFISQMMPFSYLGAGGILWFLSARLFGGVVALILKSMCKEKTTPICFVVSILLYNSIIISYGHLDTWYEYAVNMPVLIGCQRALAGILLGGFLGNISPILYQMYKLKRWVLFFEKIIIVVLPIGILMTTLIMSHTVYDSCIIVAFSVLMILVNKQDNQIHSKLLDALDSMCMPLYIFQVCSILIASFLVKQLCWQGAVLSITIDILISVIWVRFFSSLHFERLFICNS